MSGAEAIVVGSGPNGLACAVELARNGVGVTVLEAEERIGGGTRSSELTIPGLVHDDCSATHPMAAGQMLSDEEKHRLTWQGQRLATEFDRKNNELHEDMQSAQAEVVDRIGRKLMDLLDRYSRQKGYDAVFDSSAQILYKPSNIDLTQDIIRLYDQAYPVKTVTPSIKLVVALQHQR